MGDSAGLAYAQQLVQQQRYAAAVPVLLDLIKTEPASSHIHYTLGYAYFQLDKLPEASEQFVKALGADPGDFASLYLLGELAERENRPDAAKLLYLQALKVNPGYEAAARKVGMAVAPMPAGGSVPGPVAPTEQAVRTAPAIPTVAGQDGQTQGAGGTQPVSVREAGTAAPMQDASASSSFFQLLQMDPTPISQRIVGLIRKLEIDRRPRLAPYLVRVSLPLVAALVLVLLLIPFASNLYPGPPIGTAQMVQDDGKPPSVAAQKLAAQQAAANDQMMRTYQLRHERDMASLHESELSVVMVLLLLLAFAVGLELWRVSRTRYIFREGRIIVEQGILRKRESFELYRNVEVTVHETLLSKLSGDGVMALHYEVANQHHRLELLGLAKFDELTRIQDDLRDVIVELRSTNWGKGLVY